MSKVTYKRLGDLINLKRGYDLPEGRRRNGPYPVISSAGITGFHDEYKVEGIGVVTGRYGTLGEMYYVEGKYWPHNTALYVTSFKGNDPKYIYYLLSCLGRIRTSDKSAVPGVNRNELHEMAVPAIVDKNRQKKIADVLSILDAKVRCNSSVNAELESMLKTIYDYWFVQFDFPDVDGKPYRSSGGKMAYNTSIKREIPEGWEVAELKDLVDLIKGNVSPSDLAEGTPYIGLEHLERKKISLSNWATSDAAASDKTVFKKNDILFGKIRPYFHKVTVAPFDGITSTDTIILRPKQGILLGLALETVFSDEFVEAATKSSTGSKMPRADWNVIRHYKVPVPGTDLLDAFNIIFQNAVEKIHLSGAENRRLVGIRDWLLPLLMTGRVSLIDEVMVTEQDKTVSAMDSGELVA